MNINRKLTASFVLVVLLSVVAIIYVNHVTMTRTIHSSYQKFAKSNATQISKTILHTLYESSTNYVRFLSQDSNVVRATYYANAVGDTQDLSRILPDFKERLQLSFIQVRKLDGEHLYSVFGDQTGASLHDDGEHEGYFGYEPLLGKFLIHGSARVLRKGKAVGVLEAGYIFSEEVLQSLADTEQVLGLFDPHSQVITSFGQLASSAPLAEEVYQRVQAACDDNAMNELCQKPQFSIARERIDGHLYLVVASALVVNDAAVATLVVAQDASAMEQDLLNAQLTTMVIGTGAIVFAIVLGVVLARGLSMPIVQLKDAVIKMSKGNFGVKVAIKSNDEIGVLADAFNNMGTALSLSTVSKNYVENIFSSMADALFVLDMEGNIQRINQATSTLFHRNESEIIGKNITVFIDSDDGFSSLFDEIKSKRTVSNMEMLCRDKHGNGVDISISGAQMCDSQGNLEGIVLLAQDISERKQIFLELERSNKQLDQFAYVVSHDLKAPLRAIANLSNWIEEDIEEILTDDTRQQMELLRGRVHRMESLINGILDYSRIGRTSHTFETVNVQKLLEDVIDSMPVPEPMTIRVGDNMPTLEAARIPMDQVFSNLISNAIKYRSSDNGCIDVDVQDKGVFYEFSVADDGPGINPQFHDKVFEIFQTLTPRDTLESTGVGLSLVKKIVEEQGGIVSLSSEEGKGATFSFLWPKVPRINRVLRH